MSIREHFNVYMFIFIVVPFELKNNSMEYEMKAER